MPIVADKRKLSDDDQSDDNTLTTPLKRKRGRPTKNGKPKDVVPKKAVVPRGRGRPRKIKGQGRGRPKKIQTIDEPEEVENGHSSAEESDEAANIPPEKGRGRTKKA